jgi:CBS domain-containing protein
MAQHKIGCVVVLREHQIVGIFSERDVLLRLNVNAAEHWNRPVRDFMTRSPETVEANARIAFAVHKMDVGGYRHLPVVSDGRIKGVISVRDILRYITDDLVSGAK